MLIVAGRGIRIANAIPELIYIAKIYPVVTTILGKDLLDDSLSKGTIGIRGTANNLIEEHEDIVIIGASLPIAQIGYDYNKFNKKKLYIYNIEEPNKLIKCKFYKIDAKKLLQKVCLRQLISSIN